MGGFFLFESILYIVILSPSARSRFAGTRSGQAPIVVILSPSARSRFAGTRSGQAPIVVILSGKTRIFRVGVKRIELVI